MTYRKSSVLLYIEKLSSYNIDRLLEMSKYCCPVEILFRYFLSLFKTAYQWCSRDHKRRDRDRDRDPIIFSRPRPRSRPENFETETRNNRDRKILRKYSQFNYFKNHKFLFSKQPSKITF